MVHADIYAAHWASPSLFAESQLLDFRFRFAEQLNVLSAA
jgi:hypothetical protein